MHDNFSLEVTGINSSNFALQPFQDSGCELTCEQVLLLAASVCLSAQNIENY